MMRITLDTNQFVKALMRPPFLATFVMAWESQRFTVVASTELIEEYERVLAYPEVAALIFPELLRAYRSHLKHDIELVAITEIIKICRDPDDDKVIATALYGMVDYLLTEDNDLKTTEISKILHDVGITTISSIELIKMLD